MALRLHLLQFSFELYYLALSHIYVLKQLGLSLLLLLTLVIVIFVRDEFIDYIKNKGLGLIFELTQTRGIIWIEDCLKAGIWQCILCSGSLGWSFSNAVEVHWSWWWVYLDELFSLGCLPVLFVMRVICSDLLVIHLVRFLSNGVSFILRFRVGRRNIFAERLRLDYSERVINTLSFHW